MIIIGNVGNYPIEEYLFFTFNFQTPLLHNIFTYHYITGHKL